MGDISYDVRIDWDGDGGFDIGDFEYSLQGWTPGGTVPPTLAQSTTRAYHGRTSGLITWGAGGSFPLIGKTLANLINGKVYSLSAWIYVPTGSKNLLWAVAGISTGSASSIKDAWVEITYSFTATGTSHDIQIWPDASPAGGEQAWVDFLRITGPGENVTSRTLDRASIKLQYGRDQARSLSPIAPGQGALEIDNESKDYSPDNSSSPLFGNLVPGRSLRIHATHNSVNYSLLNAYLEDYQVDPRLDARSVTFTALDALGQLQTINVSTALYQGIRTGAAIGIILDAVGWTAARDIDYGSSVLSWWWEEGVTALDAIKDILAAEGPGAIVYIGDNGEFIYRDRSARAIRTESKTSQVTFHSINEPAIDQDIDYDVGWRDIVNDVSISVDEKIIDVGLSTVYQDKAIRQIATGETVVITAKANDVFIDAVTPTVDVDYVLRSGAVSITLSRTSGESCQIRITASSAAQIEGMAFRAYKLNTLRTVLIASSDQDSVSRYKLRALKYDAKFIGINDAQAIADTIIANHKDRLPIVTIKIINKNDTRAIQMLSRNISDRVHITIPEANVDSDFYIERIEHVIHTDKHETWFGCEKVLPDFSGEAFVLDVSLLDTGKIGKIGFINPSDLFILDSGTQGLIGTNLLGY